MKSPLRYQATRYDCGPTSMLNAIIFLFEREEIPPDIVRHIGLCTLDGYDRYGHCGMTGTTGAAMRYFGDWLNELRHAGLLPVESEYIEKEEVHLKEDGKLYKILAGGGVAIDHVFHDVGHYILLTGLCECGVKAFDPYYRGNEVQREGVKVVRDRPLECNIILPFEVLEDTWRGYYSMGETDTREALLIGRADKDILYMI